MENSNGNCFSFSLSSLMCDEECEATFFEEDEDENSTFIVLEDEEEYIEYLFKQETGFESHTHFFSYNDDVEDDDLSRNRYWLRNARIHAIDWIFNVSFHPTNKLTILFFIFLFPLISFDCSASYSKLLLLLIQTQAKFGFGVQTAYLSVTYFDGFLSKRSIHVSLINFTFSSYK